MAKELPLHSRLNGLSGFDADGAEPGPSSFEVVEKLA
jgi:hypothetical protein